MVAEKTLGWIYLLPSDAQNVIVKYNPKWTISCVVPASLKKITAYHRQYSDWDDPVTAKETLEIQIPELIWSHSIKKPWEPSSLVQPYFSLHAIDLSKSDGLFVTPYLLANIYTSAKVCYGGDSDPTNLRQAANRFWQSPFNEDNCPYKEDHRKSCDERNHEYYDHDFDDDEDDSDCNCECCTNICGCRCGCCLEAAFFTWIKEYDKRLKETPFTKRNSFFCGKKYFACPRPTTAVFISNNKSLFKQVPKTVWRRDYKNTEVVIGVAYNDNKRWNIDTGSVQFTIAENEAKII